MWWRTDEASKLLDLDIWLCLWKVFGNEFVKLWNAILYFEPFAKRFNVFLHALPVRKMIHHTFQDIWAYISIFVLISIPKCFIKIFLNKESNTRDISLLFFGERWLDRLEDSFEFLSVFCVGLMLYSSWGCGR